MALIAYSTFGRLRTHQQPFPEIALCPFCDSEARMAFVLKEDASSDEGWHLCDMHDNDDLFWPHDLVAVAVYFCTNVGCAKAVSLWNQA